MIVNAFRVIALVLAFPVIIVAIFETEHAVHVQTFASGLFEGMTRSQVDAYASQRLDQESGLAVNDTLPIAPGASCTATAYFRFTFVAARLARWERNEVQSCGASGTFVSMFVKPKRP